MKVTRRHALGLAGAALGSSFVSSRVFAQAAPMNATSAIPVSSLSYLAQDIAIVKGFWKAENLEIKSLVAGGGARMREMVGAGQVELGIGDSNHPLLLTGRGRPSKILMSLDNRSPLANIVIRKDLFDQGINTMEKVAKYKRPDGSKPVFAVSSLGGGQHVYIAYLAEKAGIVDNFIWIAGGAEKTMLGGLSTKKFDIMGALPNWRFEAVENKWGEVAFDVADDKQWNGAFGGPVPSTVAFALETTIKNKPQMVQAYVNGLYKALQWLKTAKPDDIYKAVADRYLGDFSEQTVKREVEFLMPIHTHTGLVDETQFKNLSPILFRDLTGIKPIAYADAVESKFIDAARKKYG